MEKKYHTINIIWNLDQGGAEVLLKSIINIDNSQSIVVFNSKKEIETSQNIFCLKGNYFQKIYQIFKLSNSNSIINLWLYKTICFCFPIYLLRNKIVFSIHHNLVFFKKEKITTKITILLTVILSQVFKVRSIFVSESSRKAHLKIGFRKKGSFTIYNGTETFKLKNTYRCKKEINLMFIARWSPIKNFPYALEIISDLITKKLITKALMVGDNVDYSNTELMTLICQKGLNNNNVELLGLQENMNDIYNLASFTLITSHSESCPMVLLESMARGIPCFSTRVGDIPLIIGANDFIFDSADEAVYKIRKYIDLNTESKKRIQTELNTRHKNSFSINRMNQKYSKLYENMFIS